MTTAKPKEKEYKTPEFLKLGKGNSIPYTLDQFLELFDDIPSIEEEQVKTLARSGSADFNSLHGGIISAKAAPLTNDQLRELL